MERGDIVLKRAAAQISFDIAKRIEVWNVVILKCGDIDIEMVILILECGDIDTRCYYYCGVIVYYYVVIVVVL